MPRFVAFLRAINVGRRIVKTEQLRELFASLGYTDVQTFIASGNVVFTARDGKSARLETAIENCVREALGFEVATFVRSIAEVALIAKHCPFGADQVGESAALYIAFLRSPPPRGTQDAVLAFGSATDLFQFDGRELYWLCRTRISDSPVSGALLEKKLAMPVTIRNSTTVRKTAAAHA